MTIGERIKEKRLEKNMSLDDLAKIAEVARQTIYKYENNIITTIPSDRIENIAKILGVSPGYLMGWESDSQIPSWYSAMAISFNKIHESSIHLIKKLRGKYPNDNDICKVLDNLSFFLKHIENLTESKPSKEEVLSDKLPTSISKYYSLNKDGRNLMDDYANMLFSNERYRESNEVVDTYHDDDIGIFAFRFNHMDKNKNE